ncbi:EAL domain-containing protein [Kineosporia sp. NBRC 101677]|uniref:EAL domain-containing protein n=1 Tax=Kineosporia sp. NBRC 101677 TaxID=3032197 RepID=UPI00255409EE|nr:EAL domain-containing protein [Kineosporia sp. NBRC 101677]
MTLSLTTSADPTGFESAATLILEDLRDRVGLETWHVSRRDGTDQVVLAAVDARLGLAAGQVLPWADSVCALVIDGLAPMCAPDVSEVATISELVRRTGLQARSCVTVPVSAPDGLMLGTLCGLGSTRHPELPDVVGVVHRQAQILGVLLAHELQLAEEVRRAERSEQAAHQDVLTSIGNRRAWDVALSREEHRAARFGTTATIVIFDLNGLKQINDTEGHEAGDQLLVRAAAELSARLRSSDTVARLGGDEFGVLLPQTPLAQARRVVADVIDRLAEVGVSVSVGMAQRSASEGLLDAWRKADAEMYVDKKRAKEKGGPIPVQRSGAGPKTQKSLPHPLQNVDAVLELLKEQLRMDVVFVNRFEGDNRQFRNLVTSIDLPIREGFVEPAQGSYCRMIADGSLPAVTRSTRQNPLLRDLPVTDRLNIGSYLGVPLHNSDGGLYGTLCAFSTTESPELGERDAQVLRGVGDVVMRLVESEDTRDDRRHRFLRDLDRLLAQGGPSAVYQAIHDLEDLSPVGYEALSRFPGGGPTPGEWFTMAATYGVGPQLELKALQAAAAGLADMAGFLSLNTSPSTLLTPEFNRLMNELPLDRVVLEMTEHEAIEDYDSVNSSLKALRRKGLRVAVDDAGAGFASMHHILALVPDFIKLDISLVRGIDRQPSKQALAASLQAFGVKTGAALIAEGIENASELTCLRQLSIQYGQGYHLSQPGALPHLDRTTA